MEEKNPKTHLQKKYGHFVVLNFTIYSHFIFFALFLIFSLLQFLSAIYHGMLILTDLMEEYMKNVRH